MEEKEINQKFITGWFGRAHEDNHSSISTKVHVVKLSGGTLCGYKPHKTMKFQFCSTGIVLGYVECPTCEKKAGKLMKIDIERFLRVPEVKLTAQLKLHPNIPYNSKKLFESDFKRIVKRFNKRWKNTGAKIEIK